MASGRVDPVATLRQALSLPADSAEQAAILGSLRETLESVPANVPALLLKTLVPSVHQQGDSLFKQWVFELLWNIVCRAPMSISERTGLALDFIEPLRELLADPNPFYIKLAVQTFGSVYPLVFRLCCNDPGQHTQWTKMIDVKTRILDYSLHPTTPLGVRIASIKFLQRVILVHTKGASDPRLQNPNDPHLFFIPSNHPFFNIATLQDEGHEVVKQCFNMFLTSRLPDVITALVQSFGLIAKLRPELVPLVHTAFVGWKPSTLSGDAIVSVRSIFKAMRIALLHFNRTYPQGKFKGEVEDAIRKIDAKSQEALILADEARRKRPLAVALDDTVQTGDPKRMKLSHSPASRLHRPVDPAILANFDFSTLPNDILIELIIESLSLLSSEQLQEAIEKWRASRPQLAAEIQSSNDVAEAVIVKEEPIDPMIMDLEEDLQLEAEGPDLDMTDGNLTNGDVGVFKLPRPRPMSERQRTLLVDSCLKRVQSRGHENSLARGYAEMTFLEQRGKPTPDMWSVILVRMITRGSWSSADVAGENGENAEESDEEEDSAVAIKRRDQRQEGEYRMRKMLFDYIISDFTARVQTAVLWLNEEWHNDEVCLKKNPNALPNYGYWVEKMLSQAADKGDRDSFSRFVLDLPELPPEMFELLREIASDKNRMPIAMATLRPLIELRIPLRNDAMTVLLELMTHPSEATRKGAIHTVRRWWPDVEPMATRIRDFTRLSIQCLAKVPDDSETLQENPRQTPGRYVPPSPTTPAEKTEITQYVEGSLALSVKDPSFLEPLFQTYPKMESTVQETLREIIIRPIHAIGPNNSRLLGYLKEYSESADSFVLGILNAFTDGNRPPPSIVSLVKTLLAEKGADARFLMLIIGEMDKAEIIRHLPKLVATISTAPEQRALVRQMFTSIVEVTQQTSTNQVREGHSKLLTPKELMIQLHDMETEVGLKNAKSAIAICIAMPEIFKSEVLASVMQHYLDAKTLPVLFLWTVLQSVGTYKHLTGWVATTLLSRLITKKVWTNPQLWEGFIYCAEKTEPTSFDALLQLPKEQLRDLVEKRPAMKSKLRDWLTKRAGKNVNSARYGGFWEVLREESTEEA